jgi:monovalent cation:H+ antiporter, CPA1 family
MISITPLLVLLTIAVLVVIAARRLRFPYTIALVVLGFGLGIAGTLLGYSPLENSVHSLLAPDLFFNLLLPPIIFEAALHVNFRLLRRRAALILSLVFIGVVFTTLFTGFLVASLTSLSLTAALLLAAILSPTDPIAVVDLMRRLPVPEELATIVESESLLNDAVGVILFVVLLDVETTGGSSNPVTYLGQFGLLVLGGVAVGLLVAGLVYLLHRQLDDPAVETAVSVVAAYGSFLLAQALGASGIIACAIAGIAVGTWVAPRAMEAGARESLNVFWSVVVYLANSVIFLAMGLVFALGQLLNYLWLILIVAAVMTLGRVAFVYAHRPLAPVGSRLPDSWYNMIAISGIRGAIPVVLALSLLSTSTGLASSTVDAIVASVLGVAFISIVAGNLVASWYVRRAFVTSSPSL